MNFFKPKFLRNGTSRMFVQSSPMAAKFKLLINADRLIPEDFTLNKYAS